MIMPSTILLFAIARAKAGAQTLTVDLPPNSTVGDLKAALALACPSLAPLLPTLRIAINSEYALDDHQPIPREAELAAIPPVSGGSRPIDY
jgi:MoaE-MoaD fusion protein